jgi:hypothetical protein
MNTQLNFDFSNFFKSKEIPPEEEISITKYLRDNNLYVDVAIDKSEVVDTVKIYISWGDWKHEHLRCDYLMNELGYMKVNVVETEEDGSDCYSAERWYERKVLI